MATLLELHDALKARLDTIDGLRTFNHPPQAGPPPVAYMVLNEWERAAMARAGYKTYRFEVYVLTAESTRPVDGYHGLCEYADSSGGKSVELAMWDGNDPTAGTFTGLANTQLGDVRYQMLGQTRMDELQMYGGLFTVEITTRS